MESMTSIRITRIIMAPKCDGVILRHHCHWQTDQIEFQLWYRPKNQHSKGQTYSIAVTISHSKQLTRITIDSVNQGNCRILKVYPIYIPSKWIDQMHRILQTMWSMASINHYLRHQDFPTPQLCRLHWIHKIICRHPVWRTEADQYFWKVRWIAKLHQWQLVRWAQKANWLDSMWVDFNAIWNLKKMDNHTIRVYNFIILSLPLFCFRNTHTEWSAKEFKSATLSRYVEIDSWLQFSIEMWVLSCDVKIDAFIHTIETDESYIK